jgi:CspA family cold shock protein
LSEARGAPIFGGLTLSLFDTLLPLFVAPVDRLGSTLPGCRSPAGSMIKETTDMANGTVKWFNSTKGFGFIQPDDGGKDVFVHISAVERSGISRLDDGQKVTYDLETGRDGRASASNLALA